MAKCILCNSNSLKVKFSFQDQYEDEYDLALCSDCGAQFLNPYPTDDQLNRAYATDYYGEGSKKFGDGVEKVLNFFRSLKAKHLSKLIKNGSKVLDVGCADGEFLHQLKSFGEYELHGLELEGKASQRALERGGFHLHIGPLSKESYEPKQFDLISLIHVFEHLPDPKMTVEILAEIINEKGYLYIEQPNIGSWQASMFKGKWLHLDPPRHLNLLSESVLIKLLDDFNFELISKSYFSPQFSPFGIQQSLLNLIYKKREVLYEHLKGNKEYTKDYSSINLFFQKLFHWLSFPIFVLTDAFASLFNKGATIRLVFRKRAS